MMKGLRFFSRTSDQRCFNLAAFHSPHSLTWRWVISFSFFKADERRVRPLWWGYQTNTGSHWGVRIPFVGMITGMTQRPIWYRDLYMRLRDERDMAAYQRSIEEPPPRGPLTIIDGGKAVH